MLTLSCDIKFWSWRISWTLSLNFDERAAGSVILKSLDVNLNLEDGTRKNFGREREKWRRGRRFLNFEFCGSKFNFEFCWAAYSSRPDSYPESGYKSTSCWTRRRGGSFIYPPSGFGLMYAQTRMGYICLTSTHCSGVSLGAFRGGGTKGGWRR